MFNKYVRYSHHGQKNYAPPGYVPIYRLYLDNNQSVQQSFVYALKNGILNILQEKPKLFKFVFYRNPAPKALALALASLRQLSRSVGTSGCRSFSPSPSRSLISSNQVHPSATTDSSRVMNLVEFYVERFLFDPKVVNVLKILHIVKHSNI